MKYQIPKIVEAGFHCISYDRKGFGKSSETWDRYDYDAVAEDLHALIDDLQLKNVVLVGFFYWWRRSCSLYCQLWKQQYFENSIYQFNYSNRKTN